MRTHNGTAFAGGCSTGSPPSVAPPESPTGKASSASTTCSEVVREGPSRGENHDARTGAGGQPGDLARAVERTGWWSRPRRRPPDGLGGAAGHRRGLGAAGARRRRLSDGNEMANRVAASDGGSLHAGRGQCGRGRAGNVQGSDDPPAQPLPTRRGRADRRL